MARLPANSVGTAQLKKNVVISSKIKDRTITGADLNKLKLGIIPLAAQATNAGHADSANNAAHADSANNADTAGHADTAGDASSLHGKQIAPLAAVAPPGTANQVAGQAGPVSVTVACGSGGSNQAITVRVTSSVGGTVRLANFHILADGGNSGTLTLPAGVPVDLLTDSFDTDTMGFVVTGGGASVAAHFVADYSHSGTGCLLSGAIAG